jgi:hypothetical protein
MLDELVPAKVTGISSSYCEITEDDVDVRWDHQKIKDSSQVEIEYAYHDETPDVMTFKHLEVYIGMEFSASGFETDAESFLDNLFVSIEFVESIFDSVYNDRGFWIDVLDSKVQPVELNVTVL